MRVYLCFETRKAVPTMLLSRFPDNPSKQGGRSDLPARITKAASKQTYYTIHFLMDRDRILDAFRAYAYFRWVDDEVDTSAGTTEEKRAILDRQCTLLEACYNSESPAASCPEEQMLVDLVGNDTEKDSGLQTYLCNMMNVMAFDVERRGRVITQAELSQYSLWLSKAVTEYMFYFIGYRDPPPQSMARYHAVYGAHIVHMLRDMLGDFELGYFNIPGEALEAGHISINRLGDQSFRKWVYGRVELAHQYFASGRKYILQVKNLRCRLAGFSYLARFEWMLRAIEQERYCLRPEYPERKKLGVVLWMAWYVFASLLNLPRKPYVPVELANLTDRCEEG
jgi:phytoene/squalene synthetase